MATVDDIKNGSIWTRRGERYVVTNNGKQQDGSPARTTKDADAANWSLAIEYQDIAAEKPLRIITADDFLSKFKPE